MRTVIAFALGIVVGGEVACYVIRRRTKEMLHIDNDGGNDAV